MKYTFVGDIHGKYELIEMALEKDGQIIFVGDFLDSFDRSIDDQEKCIQLVLDAIEKGKARSILGNHELNYIAPRKHRCSGYSLDTDSMLMPYKNSILYNFDPYLKLPGNWLVTHAGLDVSMMEQLDSLDNMYDWVCDVESAAHWVGYARGGFKPCGGIFWCDFNLEFEPIEGLNQIFGHSSFKGYNIRHKKGKKSYNYNIDCLDKKVEFLELDL